METELLDEAINRLSGGSGICFTGAGFSSEATDPFGLRLPTTRQLEEELCDLIELPRDEGGSLTDLADFCHNAPSLEPKLRLHLVKRLTLSKPSDEQRKFFQAPWRSIFTTNFDDVAERCLKPGQFQVVRPQSTITSITPGKLPIYYLHGRARDLSETNVEPLLVLSERNYLELPTKNKNLHSALENELHCASQIVFIGYSIRDIEIASRLFHLSDSLRSKTIVICHPSDGRLAQARLDKFGHVLPIGLTGLVSRFPNSFKATNDEARLHSLSFVRRTPPEPAKEELTKADVDNLIISGSFSYSAYAHQKRQTSGTQLYCVDRTAKINELFGKIDSGLNKFVVSSDIGNGKSLYLEQLAYEAHRRAYEVFRIDNRLTEGLSELEYLLKRTALQLFIVDDLVRHKQFVKFIAPRLPKLSVLVCSDRNVIDGDYEERLAELLQGSYEQIDLDTLSGQEIQQWDRLLEGWGLWGDLIELPEGARLDFLKKECSSENRSIIVSMFARSRIADQINDIVSFFNTRYPQHRRAFIAILISSLCQDHVDWNRIVGWLKIDETQLRRDIRREAVFNFTSNSRDWHKLTSAQLAHHIFTKFAFEEDLLVDVYTQIVRETAYASSDPRSGFDSKENLKELMKYRFLTKIFGESKNSTASIRAVYARLANAPLIRRNDQFWLQYAMSSMDVGNLIDAETHLETALGLARAKGVDYSDHQIRDQRIRLYLMKNARCKGAPSASEIDSAILDLDASLRSATRETLVYPMRSTIHVEELLEAKGDVIGTQTRRKIRAILLLAKEICGSKPLLRTQRGEQRIIEQAIASSIRMLEAE